MKAIVRPNTLKEQALTELRNSIMFGTFKPGERLVERTLSDKLQVSRTVVRECIRHLESERLVSIIPNSGPVVTELDQSEVKEIYRIRALLESEGVYQCALNINARDSQRLVHLVDRIETHLSNNQVTKALDLTTRLYAKIFLVSGLSVTGDLIAQLNSRINQLRIRSLSSTERRRLGPNSLRAMVDAIARNSAEEAAQACKLHVVQAMNTVLRQTDKLKNSAGEEDG